LFISLSSSWWSSLLLLRVWLFPFWVWVSMKRHSWFVTRFQRLSFRDANYRQISKFYLSNRYLKRFWRKYFNVFICVVHGKYIFNLNCKLIVVKNTQSYLQF
jgi:hypothetical protein